MVPAEELRRLAQALIDKGEAANMSAAFVLAAREHPDVYRRYSVSPQHNVIKHQVEPPPLLVAPEERTHWAITQLNAKVDEVLKQLPRLPRHAAYARVLKTPEGQVLAEAYQRHRTALITAHQARG